jgi:hypothetical protein
VERVTWDWIINGLDDALDFCRSLGLVRQVETSRFQEHRACLAELAAALTTGGQEAARSVFDGNRLRALAALTEGAELAEILPFAQSAPPGTVKRKLAEVLRGPTLPTDEDPNTNQARNILFELNLASKLWRAGLGPELGEHPDVRCWVDGRALYVHCKRPFSAKGARQAYTDALGQIARDLGSAPEGARGIVALSLD